VVKSKDEETIFLAVELKLQWSKSTVLKFPKLTCVESIIMLRFEVVSIPFAVSQIKKLHLEIFYIKFLLIFVGNIGFESKRYDSIFSSVCPKDKITLIGRQIPDLRNMYYIVCNYIVGGTIKSYI
jgi:hypothetical protein